MIDFDFTTLTKPLRRSTAYGSFCDLMTALSTPTLNKLDSTLKMLIEHQLVDVDQLIKHLKKFSAAQLDTVTSLNLYPHTAYPRDYGLPASLTCSCFP